MNGFLFSLSPQQWSSSRWTCPTFPIQMSTIVQRCREQYGSWKSSPPPLSAHTEALHTVCAISHSLFSLLCTNDFNPIDLIREFLTISSLSSSPLGGYRFLRKYIDDWRIAAALSITSFAVLWGLFARAHPHLHPELRQDNEEEGKWKEERWRFDTLKWEGKSETMRKLCVKSSMRTEEERRHEWEKSIHKIPNLKELISFQIMVTWRLHKESIRKGENINVHVCFKSASDFLVNHTFGKYLRITPS